MWNGGVSAGDLGLLILVGIIAVAFGDIVSAVVAGQHREPPIEKWDAAHQIGKPPRKAPKPPLKHRAQRIWNGTRMSRTIARARKRHAVSK